MTIEGVKDISQIEIPPDSCSSYSALPASALIRRSLRCRSPRRSGCCGDLGPPLLSSNRVDLDERGQKDLSGGGKNLELVRINLIQGRSCC